jgi:hypothetical protein
MRIAEAKLADQNEYRLANGLEPLEPIRVSPPERDSKQDRPNPSIQITGSQNLCPQGQNSMYPPD